MNTSNRKLAWVYVGLIVLGFCLSKFGHARIDPEDVIGLWLFDEQSGKTIKGCDDTSEISHYMVWF